MPDNHRRLPATEQPSPHRRDEVLKQITLALVDDNGISVDTGRRGFDPYDCRLGAPRRDVWGRRRRA